MTTIYNSRRLPAATTSVLLVAGVAVLCVSTFGNGQPSPQNVIKRKLVIAEELRLDLSGTNLGARLQRADSGRVSLAFFDRHEQRHLSVGVYKDGAPSRSS